MRKYHCIDYKLFGNRIAARRTELHLSQKLLAEKLDCNESYLSKIENGKAQPTLDFVFLLARELEVGVDYFLPGTTAGSDIIKRELQDKWTAYSPELAQFLTRLTDEAQSFESAILTKDKLY